MSMANKNVKEKLGASPEEEATTKFVTDLENVAQTLKEYGVAVLPGVLSEKECGALVDGVWNVSNCNRCPSFVCVHASHASVYCEFSCT